MHRILNISENLETDITPLIGSIQWRSNINELGDQLDFDIAFNDAQYFPKNPVDIGNAICLVNQEELFRGVVVTEQKNGRQPIQYTCFDYAFYLNKNKAVYQFNKIAAKKAIEMILTEHKIPIGNISQLNTVIKKIYVNEPVSDIIRDLIDIEEKETGVKYRMEMRRGKLHIEKKEDLLVKATFKLAENIAAYDVTRAISNPSRKRSIEEMKNRVGILLNDQIIETKEDQDLIRKYGVLQEFMQISNKDKVQAKNIAQKMLEDLGKIFEENSIELPGNDQVRAGRTLELEEPITGMIGKYLVKDVIHRVEKGIHRMSVGLEAV
ncbi:XkdQ/YqbQ family protein [Geosporobacter ferrireducens]|uniref:YqbQ/XkdQ domain-containing protein n=1 Tax=Geosporobacter ferrireducens TaxID=1424294 RepID=A0A1D8GIE9_9FIRM|nr:hypothetical protein [Geosporobacter ferrireducens]AOT70689.1 hypothetical protein Gferi_14570 [Geosporobacter ferrireducens]MTI57490.1 hypothetical protein [Geosporobacter ferrireducens]